MLRMDFGVECGECRQENEFNRISGASAVSGGFQRNRQIDSALFG
jgi:hypothetical protein